jgi:Domain of unknown function (DUF4372)
MGAALVRKFKSREQLIALLYGQLAGANSLRDIIAGLSSHQARLYHIGGKVPARSTFADANRDRSYDAFSLRAYARHGGARSQT